MNEINIRLKRSTIQNHKKSNGKVCTYDSKTSMKDSN